MWAMSGAGSLAAATVRLRRAGRLPVPVELPAVLLRDRLAAVVREPDTEREVARALARLAAAGSDGRPQQMQPAAAPTMRPVPSVAMPAPRAERAGAALRRREQSNTPDRPAGPTPAPAARSTAGPPARLMARSTAWPIGAPLGSVADRLLPISADPGPLPVTAAGPPTVPPPAPFRVPPPERGPTTAPSATERLSGWRTAAGPVRVRRDPELAILLGDLARPGASEARSAGPPVSTAALRGHPPTPIRTARRAGAPRVPPRPPLPDPTAPAGATLHSGQAAATASALAGPHPSTAATEPGPGPSPRTAPTPGPREVFTEPPVGLAGLVGWWQAQSVAEPGQPGDPAPFADTAPFSDTGTRPAAPPSAYRPDGDFGPNARNGCWSAAADTPIADSEQLRDALERLLLDEALADGLEVSDGPA